jgi:hypothetical protein
VSCRKGTFCFLARYWLQFSCGGTLMQRVYVTCPTTGQLVRTTVEASPAGLAKSWNSSRQVACPHCSQTHEINIRHAYLNQAISELDLSGAADERVALDVSATAAKAKRRQRASAI